MVMKKLQMELKTHFKLYSLNHGKLMGSGYVSSGILLSSVYKIQKRATSSGALTTITPLMHLRALQARILYLSCNKNVSENALLRHRDLLSKCDSYYSKYLTRLQIDNFKKFLNKCFNERNLPGISSQDHPNNKPVLITCHSSLLEQDPIIVFSVLEYRLRMYMSDENIFIKEYVKALILEHENMIFVSKITSETTMNDITKVDLVFESLKRHLLKQDEKKPVTLKDTAGKEIKVGDSFYSFKLTPLFMALYNNLYYKENSKELLSIEKINIEKPVKLGLIVLPVKYINNNTFMPTGIQNHINTAIFIDELKNKALAFGFLTTQKLGENLAKYQFDIFQQKLKTENSGTTYEFPPKLLPQRFIPLRNMLEFDLESIRILKNGTEYLQDVSKTKLLYQAITGLSTKPIYKGKNCGISLEQILEVCKKYDYNDKHNIPQPKTELKIKQDNENKEAMKLKVLEKNKEQQFKLSTDEI